MKATEFVKKFGWDLAIRDIAALKGGFIKRGDFLEHYGFDILDDLENLVNAYELVEVYGGLDKANKVVSSGYIDSNHDIPDGNIELSMAIKLLESVNE